MTTVDQWIEFCEKLGDATWQVLGTVEVKSGPLAKHDPKVLACALLARTSQHLRAVIVLIKAGQVVEARTIARCCFENLLWVGALSARGAAFVKKMQKDEAKSREMKARFVLEDKQTREAIDKAMRGQFATAVGKLQKRYPKADRLSPKSVAQDGPINPAYLYYTQISGDAAHASLLALDR